MAGIHPSQEFKQQQEQYRIAREIYQKQIEASIGVTNNELRRLDDKPEPKSEPCEFVFMGKVKTCGKHGILCEEL
jgi:hypothetical protein